MAVMRNGISLAIAAMLLKLAMAMAANYTVGGSTGGWDTTTDLQTWVASLSFSVGDNLLFQYGSDHSVVEVSKAGYDLCQTSNAIQVHQDGSTVIPLSSPDKRYFICGTPGHCTQGMKLAIDILAASTTPSSPPSPSTAPPPALPPSNLPQPSSLSPIKPPVASPSEITPAISPPSPPESPLGSPESMFPSPDASLLPPSPSSAPYEQGSFKTSLIASFSIVMMALLAL